MKKKTKSSKYEPDFFQHAKNVLGQKRMSKAVKRGHQRAFELKLKMAREMLGLTQSELKGITQPDVSKIEMRKDLKISTLYKYAEALGMKVQICLISEDEEIAPIAICS